MSNKLKKIILNFFFPQSCLGCGKEKEKKILCQQCLEKTRRPNTPKIKRTFIAADYGDLVIRKAIWLLKYKKAKTVAKPLAELMHQRLIKDNLSHLGTNFPSRNELSSKVNTDFLIIPIPLSKQRMRERGFNQSELLAKHLSDILHEKNKNMSFRLSNNVLYKSVHKDTQVSITDKRTRLNNAKGTFSIRNNHLIKNKNIILIDDVTTTGATIDEASKTLLSVGAKSVVAFVIANG